MPPVLTRLVLSLALLVPPAARAALGDAPLLVAPDAPGALVLVAGGRAAPLVVSEADWPGVRRAAADLQADFARVSGVTPVLGSEPSATPVAILAGTLGRSPLIDGLVASGRLDVADLRGRREAFVLATVEQPVPGVDRALVIAGADKRGTIYGLYELSQQIGVSPWYWWADVVPAHRDTLAVAAGRRASGEPVVRYRGIFLNDEAPDLTNWIRAKFGEAPVRADPPVPAGVANYGREFYARIFEVLLRLRGNYLWPAMWNNAFNEDDPGNARLADEYGIVMGTSHQEPMLRAQKEWDRRYLQTLGTWNYAQHPEVLENFWREGVRRNRAYESVITLGLRGANDTEMAPGGPDANRALLERIVDRQRQILREEVNPDLAQVPQVWCLYKEVQEFYEHGMRVPDDVTLLWAEDNWGNLRRLPTAAERRRPGGAGIYYHFDYHGGPRSYQWLNTSPLPKIREQLSLAHAYGADRVWIVNAGHFKGYELPVEFFLRLAWDPARWTADDVAGFTRAWAEREFGPAHAADIADLVAKYPKYHGRRKPELLRPNTYSLVDYREAETVVGEWRALAQRAGEIGAQLPAEQRDAYHQLVEFPVAASAVVQEIYHAAGRNALYARQGRASTAAFAGVVDEQFALFQTLVNHYNGDFAGGRWAHFMDQPVLGYTTWRDPPENSLKHLTLARPPVADQPGLGVAIEGREEPVGAAATLPPFDALNRQESWFEVFASGRGAADYTVTVSEPWIRTRLERESTIADPRTVVSVDWDRVPPGRARGTITVTAHGQVLTTLAVEALTPADVTRATLDGFAEGRGVVSIEPEHFTRHLPAGDRRWVVLPDYGRTLSGLRAEGPVDAPAATPGRDAPCLEYRLYLTSAGPAEVNIITGPTLNFVPDRGLRYAVSLDDEAPQVVTLVPAGYQAQNRNADWERSVADNAHTGRSRHAVVAPGYHTLKVWMVDPAVVVQKIVVDLGGLKPSYLGPPESFHGPRPVR